MKADIQFTLNGQPVRVRTEGDRLLLWVLRTDLGVTGPKYGCGEGLCGACTVVVDDEAVLACQTTVAEVKAKRVLTVEGLARDGRLHPIQQAFVEQEALQCGYCTPGMILKAYGFLSETPRPSQGEIVQAMEGNLCRCGAHKRIVEAIDAAAKEMNP
jgi:carbon-monoxide dehydrogenase small subunit